MSSPSIGGEDNLVRYSNRAACALFGFRCWLSFRSVIVRAIDRDAKRQARIRSLNSEVSEFDRVDMQPEAILLPVFAMVCLTAVVWATLYVQRIGEMSRKRIDAEQLSSAKAASALLLDQRASDKFRNLFELPVLFYVGTLFAYATAAVDVFVVGLAWAFVALRAAHSIVHCGYNRVTHRFAAYALSTLVLWALWARLALVWFA